jgi:hypothetical protein
MTDSAAKMGDVIVPNVTFIFAKLVKAEAYKPGETPNWSIQIRTTDKDQKNQWKEMGLNVKSEVPDGDEPPYFKVNVYRKIVNSKGEENEAPEVVGSKLEPLDGNRVGHGSKGNLKLFWYIGSDGSKYFHLKAVQITEWVDYQPVERNELAFEAMDDETVIITTDEAPVDFDDDLPF